MTEAGEPHSTTTSEPSRWNRYFPITDWLPKYKRNRFSKDGIAGIVVWALVVPESLAYATIAGLPVEYGLYSVPLAALGYAIFGTSRQMYVGPSATIAALSFAVVAPLAAAGSPEFISLTIALAIMVGIVFIAFGLLRMGFLAKFLAKPVLGGFILGVAIVIVVGQLDKIFGVESVSGNALVEFVSIFTQFLDWSLPTMAVGFSALALLIVLAKYAPKVPGALIVVFLFIFLSGALNFQEFGIHVVGFIPSGLPSYDLAPVSVEAVIAMIPGALAIVLIGFAESVAFGKLYARKHDYKIKPSQEMTGLGAANLGSAALTGFVVAGSLSKTSVNDQAGGQTAMVLLIVAILGFFTFLLLAGLFTALPEAVLGAVVIYALGHHVRLHWLGRMWRSKIADFWPALGALLGVLLVGIIVGVLVGVILSAGIFLYRSNHPSSAVLGRDPTGRAFGDPQFHPDYVPVPGVPVYRFGGPLIFSNSDRFLEEVERLVDKTDPRPRAVVIDAEVIGQMDTTASDALQELHHWLEARGIQLVLARLHGEVADLLERDGTMEAIGAENVYTTVHEAVEAYERRR